jgi:hypothetical protein
LLATRSKLCVDLAIAALAVDPDHGQVDALVDVHAGAVNLRARTVSSVALEDELWLAPVKEVGALTACQPSTEAKAAEANILLQSGVVNDVLIGVAVSLDNGIPLVRFPVDAVRRECDVPAVFRSGLTEWPAVAHFPTAAAVIPVHALPTAIGIRVARIVQHRNPLAIEAADAQQVVLLVAVIGKEAQLRFNPVNAVGGLGVGGHGCVGRSFVVVKLQRLESPIFWACKIPELEAPSGLVVVRGPVDLATALPGSVRTQQRIVGMPLRRMYHACDIVHPFDADIVQEQLALTGRDLKRRIGSTRGHG